MDGEELNLPYFLGLNRAMVSLGPYTEKRYCLYRCKFCYVRGPFPRYQQAKPNEIVEWLKQHTGKYKVVYVSGDTDSFALPRTEEGLELLEALCDLDIDVLFTTRHVFDNEQTERLAVLAQRYRERNRLLIGCVSVCQLDHPELEPKPLMPPTTRIEQLGTWKGLGISTVLAIRPFIRGVEPDQYSKIARMGSSVADVVIGGDLYVDTTGNISKKLTEALPTWNPNVKFEPVGELDFTDSDKNWHTVSHVEAENAVRAECSMLGLPFFMRSSRAVDHFQLYREHYVAGRSQRTFSSKVMNVIAQQTEIAKVHSKDQASTAKNPGLEEFISENIERKDIHPAVQPNDDKRFHADGSQLIDPSNPLFRGAHKILQEEIESLLQKNFGSAWRTESEVAAVLIDGDVANLRGFYGSTSAGWDALVAMKSNLILYDRESHIRASWLTSLVVQTEMILRELICAAVEKMGSSTAFKLAISDTLTNCIPLNHSSKFGEDLKSVSECLRDYMSQSAKNTFDVTLYFSRSLSDGRSTRFLRSREKMCANLMGLGSDSGAILQNILQLQISALHRSELDNRYLPAKLKKVDPFSKAVSWSPRRCRLISQFVVSFAAEASILCLSSALKDGESDAKELLSILETKSRSEIRVQNLSLLKGNLFWLAWFWAEASELFLEENDSLMLKLNAAYASKKLSEHEGFETIFDKSNLPIREDHWDDRYVLIWKSLAEEFSDLTATLEAASKTMTISEFEGWPALEYLKSHPEFIQFILEKKSSLISED